MVISPVEANPAGKRQAVRRAVQEGGQGSLSERRPYPSGEGHPAGGLAEACSEALTAAGGGVTGE